MSTEAILGYALATIITSMGTYALTKLSKFLKKKIKKLEKEELDSEINKYLLEGMAIAQEQVVRKAKMQSNCGKLTNDEIEQAKSLAIEHARQVASGKAKEALLKYTDDHLASIIKLLLTKLKRG